MKFDLGLNLFIGHNGAGKTSILESLHTLCMGKSFKTVRLKDLVRHDRDWFRIEGNLGESPAERIKVKASYQKQFVVSLGEQKIRSSSELAKRFPIAAITPETYLLLQGGAEKRRKLVDWYMFHVEPSYADHFAHYMRALKQRNELLKSRIRNKALDLWTEECARYGETLNEMRMKRVPDLMDMIENLVEMHHELNITLEFYQGWDAGAGFLPCLNSVIKQDLQLGYTTVGPHRSDVKCLINDRAAKNILSRGESRALCASMVLASAYAVAQDTGSNPIMLLDDVDSELDSNHFSSLIQSLADAKMQILATSVHKELQKTKYPLSTRMFHVEQGIATTI